VLRPTTLIAALLAGALLAAGCGGGGGDSTTTNATTTTSQVPTKADYIVRGDRICAEGTYKIGNAARMEFGAGQPTAAQVESFTLQTVVPVFQEQLAALRALPPPAGDEKKVAAIYDALQKGIAQISANPSVFTQPNAGGVLAEASRLARAYGFKQCGQS
jgi:hypothetical protein